MSVVNCRKMAQEICVFESRRKKHKHSIVLYSLTLKGISTLVEFETKQHKYNN